MRAWIRRPAPTGAARARLLCFPHAGGAAGSYRALALALGADVEVLAVQYPGRQDRLAEPPVEDASELIEAVFEELPPAILDDGKPLALFGHSMGTVPAFEAARRLAAEGRAPAALFASARQGPSWDWKGSPVNDLHVATDEKLVAEIRRHGVAEELLALPEFLSLSLPALRSDYRLLHSYVYRPGPLLECPLIALVGDQDPLVPPEHMKSWERETRGTFELVVLPGGHFYLDDRAQEVAGIVSDVLGSGSPRFAGS